MDGAGRALFLHGRQPQQQQGQPLARRAGRPGLRSGRRIWSGKRCESGLISILVTDLSGGESELRFNKGLKQEGFLCAESRWPAAGGGSASVMPRRQRGHDFHRIAVHRSHWSASSATPGCACSPLYLNYMKVAKTMDAAAAEFKTDNRRIRGMPSRAPSNGIGRSRTSRASTTRTWRSKKDDNGLTLHVAYDDSAPYIANVSLAVHFDKTVKVQ